MKTNLLVLQKWASLLWAILGAHFIYEAACNSIKWQSAPFFARVGLTWDGTNIFFGVLALGLALTWISHWRYAVILGKSVAIFFGLYSFAYFFFGDERASFFQGQSLESILVFCLSVFTWLILSQKAAENDRGIDPNRSSDNSSDKGSA